MPALLIFEKRQAGRLRYRARKQFFTFFTFATELSLTPATSGTYINGIHTRTAQAYGQAVPR
jgi:hypothetical protein